MFFISYLGRVWGELFSILPCSYPIGSGTYESLANFYYAHHNYTFGNLGNDTWHCEPDLGQDIYDPMYHHSKRGHYDTLGINVNLDILPTAFKIFGYSTFSNV